MLCDSGKCFKFFKFYFFTKTSFLFNLAYDDALQFVNCQIDRGAMLMLGSHGVCLKKVHNCMPLELLCGKNKVDDVTETRVKWFFCL